VFESLRERVECFNRSMYCRCFKDIIILVALFCTFSITEIVCVNRGRLLLKVGKDYDVTGKLFLHSRSFLSNRCARLKIDKNFGEWIESSDGTSAANWLGPLLFIIYVHDVPVCIAPKFADNLVSVVLREDMKSVLDQLRNSADELVEWAKENDMDLSVSKTKVLIFGDNSDEVKITTEGSVFRES